MADARLGTVLRHVRRLALPAHTQGLSDAQLLERFRAGREESAFAALMQRHGGLVWGVCRNVLGHAQDAEDAFQATFLVLARQAAAVRDGATVAGWLHGTAYRIAMRAKRDAARRRTHEGRAKPAAAPSSEGAWRELQAALDDEVQALPDRQRAVFALCVLEGKSHAEAAAALGWKEGTVSGTLARARAQLRGRLARRGIALSALLTGLVVARQSATAAPALAGPTLRAALGTAAVSPRVAALVKGVTDTMMSTKMKAVTALLLTVAIAAGAGAVARQAPPPPAEPDRAAPARADEKAKPSADAQGDPLPDGAVDRLGTVRFRHDGDVDAFALSPDGKTLATAGRSTIVLWDAATGKERSRIASPAVVRSLTFTPDGKSLASGADDNTIRLWDGATGKEQRKFEGHEAREEKEIGSKWVGVYRLLFAPDGKTLVSRGADNTVRVWDAGTGKQLHRFEGVSGFYRALALSPDGKTLAATVGDFKSGPSELRLWDPATGRELRRLPQKGTATCLAFSADGKTLAMGLGPKGWDQPGDLVLWDASTFKEVRTLKGHTKWVTAAAFSPDGKTLFTGSYDAKPRLWDAGAGKELAVLGTRLPVYDAAFSSDGKLLVAQTGNITDHAIRVWDVATRKEVGRLAGHQSAVSVLAFSADGKSLASGSADATVGLWDLAARKEVHRLEADGWGGTAIGFSADGRALLSGGMGSNAVAWDAKTAKEVRKFDTGDGYFGRMAFSPDGKVVASWGRQRDSVGLWDTATGKELRRLDPVPKWVNALAFSPDGSLLAVGTGQGPPYITVWEVRTGRLVHQMGGEGSSWVWSLAFSADGRTLASGHDDRRVRVWEVATGGQRFAFDHGDRAGALAFSPDGSLLASACNETTTNFATMGVNRVPGSAGKDGDTVRLWDPFTGAPLHTLAGHRGAIASLAFSPDGTLLASGGNDTTILLWDATKLPRATRPKGTDLGAKELAARWADLADADAARAYRGMKDLAAAPRSALAHLKEQVRPVVLADPKRVARLLTDLDSEEFDTREKAGKELEQIGAGVEPALRKALAERPPLDVARRIEGVLNTLEGQQLSRLRAVEVLERIDTDEARKQLAALADGAPGARLTREAKAALDRLKRRDAKP
jgi:RNA polymerase sigma factor (sigma-70 family)